jgi:hypothetical protein
MARSSVSTFARSLFRRCISQPIAAAVMALGLGGAVAGGALALSPTVDTALVFRGGVSATATANAGTRALAYTVPAGKKFMLTDLVITNSSETSPAIQQYVLTGQGVNCTSAALFRTDWLSVPAAHTLHLPFVTGIGFAAGQQVCVGNADADTGTSWTIRGYLFE